MGKTKIEWATHNWNVVRGCNRVSPGCDNCYAMGEAHRYPWGQGLTRIRTTGEGPRVDWSGEIALIKNKLAEPLGWRKPRRVFVCSTSDLFHHNVPFEYIAATFGAMALARDHTFQVLTKRPARAAGFFAWAHAYSAKMYAWEDQVQDPTLLAFVWRFLMATMDEGRGRGMEELVPTLDQAWPLPNVWVGTSVEDQHRADVRIPELLQVPAAVRWLSVEPLLGPLDLSLYMGIPGTPPLLDWVVCGGESGPRARPFNLGWARSLRDQCHAAGVAFFLKQLGARPCSDELDPSAFGLLHDFRSAKGGDMDEWPEDLRVREYPEVPHV